jgi:aspartate kinase
MKTSPGIAAKMFRVLADNDVNIEMISTSTIRISVVTRRRISRRRRGRCTPRSARLGQAYSAPLPERR